MSVVKDICGYLIGLALCIGAFLLCHLAWVGLDDMFGWRWALAAAMVGVVVRVNLPVLVGLYFYAANVLGWPQAEALAFALPGLLMLTPSMAVEVFGLLVGTAARR